MKVQDEQFVEFRYYEMPIGRYDLALLGEEWVCEYGRDPLHFHNYLEIGYCYYGVGYICYGEEKKSFRSGTISIIPSNFPHRTQGEEGRICKWEYLFIDVGGLIEQYFSENPYLQKQYFRKLCQEPYLIDSEEHQGIAVMVRKILDENREQKPYYKNAIEGCLLALGVEVLRLAHDYEAGSHVASEYVKIAGSLQYIESNYMEEIKIQDLAVACNLSESYFRKLFLKCMNMPPLEYVNLVRIQKACDIMSRTEESVEMLAWKSGFSSVSTFTRNFKKYVGESPKQWAHKHGKDKQYVNYRTKALKGW
jgi:AraC-like DNA-binding protein